MSQFNPTDGPCSRARLVTVCPYCAVLRESYHTTDMNEIGAVVEICLVSEAVIKTTYQLFGLDKNFTSRRNATLKIHRETYTPYTPPPEALARLDQLVNVLLFWLYDANLCMLDSIGKQQL